MQSITALRNTLATRVFKVVFDLTAVLVFVPLMFAYNFLMQSNRSKHVIYLRLHHRAFLQYTGYLKKAPISTLYSKTDSIKKVQKTPCKK